MGSTTFKHMTQFFVVLFLVLPLVVLAAPDDKKPAAGDDKKPAAGGDEKPAAAAAGGDDKADAGAKKPAAAAAGGDDKADAGAKKPEAAAGGDDKPAAAAAAGGGGGEFLEMNWGGKWDIFSQNAGVSAMHLQIMPKNGKAIMYDTETTGMSKLRLPKNHCLTVRPGVFDCWAHGVEFDINTGKVRPLFIASDPWCSSGGLTPGGRLLSTGGNLKGFKSIRHMSNCNDGKCTFDQSPKVLGDNRWYATQCMLPDGNFIVVGGRKAYSYEILNPAGVPQPKVDLPFLKETDTLFENNLYPFVHLVPDGNLFIFANRRAILFSYRENKIIKNYPDIPDGPRNYPPSGCSAILPIKLDPVTADVNDIEILICGGGQEDCWGKALQGVFLPTLNTCGKIKVLDPNPTWEMDKMPVRRIMSDMLILPNGQILIVNGAQMGSSGWDYGDVPCLSPLLYTPNKPLGQRFKSLSPSKIPRMYHSSSAVLPEGKVLVAGSNPHEYYVNTGKFPTEVRVEKFSPPYLDAALTKFRPTINAKTAPQDAKYGGKNVEIPINFTPGVKDVKVQDILVSFYKPPFTTHGNSMDQRLLMLPVKNVAPAGKGDGTAYTVSVDMPVRREIAPPGYYLLSVVYKGVPSASIWVHLI